jgi:hypothetical protein
VAGSWTTSDQGVPPASLSSLLLLEPHGNGEQADEAGYPWGTARCLSGEAGARPKPSFSQNVRLGRERSL